MFWVVRLPYPYVCSEGDKVMWRDEIADWYDRKRDEAAKLSKQLEEAKVEGRPPHEIQKLEQELELARNQGD